MEESSFSTDTTSSIETVKDLDLEIKGLTKELKNTKTSTKRKLIAKQISVLKKQKDNLKKANQKSIKVISYQMETKEFKSSLLKLMRPYYTTKRRIIYPLIILLGLCSALSTLFLIQNTGLYSMGVSGILQGIARISKTSIEVNYGSDLASTVYNILFWSLYFIFNIPLLIFAYYKISKKFALLTILYVCTSQLFGLALSFIPNIDTIFIFGNVKHSNAINIIRWSNSNDITPLFFYSSLQGLVVGFCYSILYMFGSSTAGTDIITFYYAKIKNMSISRLLIIFNSISILFSSFLGTICPLLITNQYNLYFSNNDVSMILQSLISPNLIFSIIIAIISAVIIAIMFPKNKAIKINIYSNNINEIKDKLLSVGLKHFLTINNTMGGFSLTYEQNIETICLYFELPEIIACVRAIDKEALIVTQKIFDIDGKIMVVSN